MQSPTTNPSHGGGNDVSDVYLRAREPADARRVLDELIADGIPRERIRVHAAAGRDLSDLPVAPVRWRSRRRAVLEGAAYGGAVGLVLGVALLLVGDAGSGALALILIGAAAGAGWLVLRSGAAQRDLEQQSVPLAAGQIVIVLQLDDDQIGRVEQRVEERHPEVLILGTDPTGTPPFP